MELTAKLCRAISKTIKSHPPEEVSTIARCLLTSAAAYSLTVLGTDKALVQLMIQCELVSKGDLDKVQEMLNRAKILAQLRKHDPMKGLPLRSENDV